MERNIIQVEHIKAILPKGRRLSTPRKDTVMQCVKQLEDAGLPTYKVVFQELAGLFSRVIFQLKLNDEQMVAYNKLRE